MDGNCPYNYRFTGVIGSGVLSLAWSVAQLGWIAGPLCMVVFGVITIISSNLLCDCCRYPHPVVGHIRNKSYAEAVRSYLGNGEIRGDLVGVSIDNLVQKVWFSSQAVGDIAFAFTCNIILLEIKDTLKTAPPENKKTKKASTTAIPITSLVFICCGCFGYAAFGNQATGNLLTGF